MSPYLQRPVRSLMQVLEECGRARRQSALVITLPRSRGLEPERDDAEDGEDDFAAHSAGRMGASA